MEKNKTSMNKGAFVVSTRTKDLTEQQSPMEQKELSEGPFFTWERFLRRAPFLCIVLIGAILRFVGLGVKPLHHDESLHAYFSLQLLHNIGQWQACFRGKITCYHYDPLLHGPFQFHIIAFVYKICLLLGVPEHGVNTTTVRIAAATLGSLMVGLPYFLQDYLGGRRIALAASFLLAISPCMVYYSRFAREDIYMAFFTLLLVVAAGRYVRERNGRWLMLAAIALTLSYATKEATFLSIAVFGSFFLAVLVWEIGSKIEIRSKVRPDSAFANYLPRTGAPLALIALDLLCLPLLKWFFNWMRNTSAFISLHPDTSNAFLQNLKNQTMVVLPWLVVAIASGVGMLWIRDMKRRKKGLLSYDEHDHRVEASSTPLLRSVAKMPWQHWVPALLACAVIFIVLYSVLLTNLQHGIADGIWQGLYYWLQQQQVARGEQPWYYYLLLLPLYEQVGLFFGIIGIVRCILHPSRFRLFLVYWCLGNLAIYSWAAEKMPWLVIHLVLPILLLAAIGLDPLLQGIIFEWKELKVSLEQGRQRSNVVHTVRTVPSRRVILCGSLSALFLLALTLQNMFQVTYVHYADAPHEMMIYVQTSLDINTVMDKIQRLDQKVDGGQHKLAIGIMSDAEWPFYWYLRDYTDVCYGFPTGCVDANPAVIIVGGDNITQSQSHYATGSGTSSSSMYLFHQYHLRTWWDEGYKPPVCVPSSQNNNCQGQPLWGGVGPLLWLSYGDTPPEGAQFDPGLALKNVWDWWWWRQSIGSTAGSTDMGLFIRSDLGVSP